VYNMLELQAPALLRGSWFAQWRAFPMETLSVM